MPNRFKTTERIVYGAGQPAGGSLAPEIREIGWGRFTAADPGHLRPHAHAGAFEICFIQSGEVDWSTSRQSYTLRAGDVFVTKPSELHWGADSAMQPCTLYWLILGAPSAGHGWDGLDPRLAARIEGDLDTLPTHRLRGTQHLETAFEAIFAEHRSQHGAGRDSLIARAIVRAELHRLLIGLLRTAERAAPLAARTTAPELSRATAALVGRLREAPSTTLDLRGFCAEHRVSSRQLQQRFRVEMGSSIAQYWLRERIRIARDRLRDSPVSVTELSTELGFSSSQHFATAFRKFTGQTPSAFRLSAAKAAPYRA